MAPPADELCLLRILERAVEEVGAELELEAAAVDSGGESSPSSSIVLLTGLVLKVTFRAGLMRLLSAPGRRGAVSCVEDIAKAKKGQRAQDGYEGKKRERWGFETGGSTRAIKHEWHVEIDVV